MSDTSRKRSRKSKLVPRDCTLEFEDVDLQLLVDEAPKIVNRRPEKILTPIEEPTSSAAPENYQCNILKRISVPPKENKEAPLKFDIKVEVENCDDFHNIPKYTENTSTSSISKNTANTTEVDCEENLKLLPFTLSEEKILQATDEILKTTDNIADKILDVYVRNNIGYERILTFSYHDRCIQDALHEWRVWQSKNFHRDSPLFYKCYVCEKSWWYLSEFKDHITQHEGISVALELHEKHESNIIAYTDTGKVPYLKDIYTEGSCFKCGQNFDAHRFDSRINCKYYASPNCPKLFYTCSSLEQHLKSCPQCENKLAGKKYSCDLCNLKFCTKGLLDQHLSICHIVRSDVPISTGYQICKTCSGRYFRGHICVSSKKEPYKLCVYCFKRFHSILSFKIHKDQESVSYACEICNDVLYWTCMKYQHMLMHTDKYMMVWKCVLCDDSTVYISYCGVLQHQNEHHDKKQLSFIKRMIIPKSCIYPEDSEATGKLKELPPPTNVPATDFPEKPRSETTRNGHLGAEERPCHYEDKTTAAQLTIIKEEPLDDEFMIEENPIEIYTPQVQIKEEYDEEIDEYEDDLIKLDINIEDFLVVKKEEPDETYDNQEKCDEADNTAEFIENVTESAENNNESDDNSIEMCEYSLESDGNTSEPGDSSMETVENPLEISEDIQKADPSVKPKISKKKQKRIYKCTKCGFKANHREYRYHIDSDCRRSDPRKQYTCTKCNNDFSSMMKYLAHFVVHGFKNLSCPVCNKKFECFTKLTPHMQCHMRNNYVRVTLITTSGPMSKPIYQCKQCSESVDMDDFFKHWELHLMDSPQTADEHLPVGDTIKDLLNHLQASPKNCVMCGRSFSRINDCKRHLIEHLLIDAYSHKAVLKQLRCQLCGAGFGARLKYKLHMRNHGALPVYKCELCDHSFSDSSNFNKHKKVHNFRVFVCDLCGKKFQMKKSLEKHIEDHKTTEPKKCEECQKVFYFDNFYRRHMRIKHAKKPIGYPCIICSQRFDTLRLKWNHMWEVHNERKHEADCPICFKSFRKFQDVRRHVLLEHHKNVSSCSLRYAKADNVVEVKNKLVIKPEIKIEEIETLVFYE